MDAIANLVREIAAQSKATDAAFATAAAPIAGGATNQLYSYALGTPVLDLVTGLEGVVIDARRENVVIPSA